MKRFKKAQKVSFPLKSFNMLFCYVSYYNNREKLESGSNIKLIEILYNR